MLETLKRKQSRWTLELGNCVLAANSSDRALLERMYRAAVACAQPEQGTIAALPDPPTGRTVVIGAGKAAARMARSVDLAWQGTLSGLIVVPYGAALDCGRISVAEASHPVPDAAGEAATKRILTIVAGLTTADLVIALISGGGSALLAAPAEGLTLSDEQQINDALLASGADIAAMNQIRSQFSRVKAGRLALACHPARLVTLVVSDVPGDDPSIVASGPTLPSAHGRDAARRLAALYELKLPTAAADLLASDRNLPPIANDPRLRGKVKVIVSARRSLEAAAELARAAGLTPHILSDRIEGDAATAGAIHAALAREVAEHGTPFDRPCVLLSGGETTVTMRAQGKGGRNTEFALSLALGIARLNGITALVADTDGIDGSSGAAGAFCDGATAASIRQNGIDPQSSLRFNDSATALDAVGNLLTTGPTGTNVNDFRAIIVR